MKPEKNEFDCKTFESRIAHQLHGEIDADLEGKLLRHVDDCPGCSRLMRFEKKFENLLRATKRTLAPASLRQKIQSRVSWKRRILNWLRPLFWASSGALLASLLLLLFLQPIRGIATSTKPEPVRIAGKIVCLGCTLRPETADQHAGRRRLDHINGLRDSHGHLWLLLPESGATQAITGDEMLGEDVELQGTRYPQIRGLLVESFKTTSQQAAHIRHSRHSRNPLDLGIARLSVALANKPLRLPHGDLHREHHSRTPFFFPV